MLARKIITDPSDAQYSSVDNQYRMLEDKQAKLQDIEENLKRKVVSCNLEA